MKRIAVFAGSSPGARPRYRAAVRALGKALAERQLELVYGGAYLGLMGTLANAVLAAGGRVTGVIPTALSRVAHPKLTELHVVGSMHERKALMADMADGFIAVPGGLGTFEEFLEAVTWAQLGVHQKPCGLLNVCNYYDGLTRFIEHSVQERFVRDKHRAIILLDSDPQSLLDAFVAGRKYRVNLWPSKTVPAQRPEQPLLVRLFGRGISRVI